MDDSKRDLAIDYIRGQLNNKDKMKVFQLISSDPEFSRILVEENKLHKAMMRFKLSLDADIKEKIFDSITKEVNEPSTDYMEFTVDYIVGFILNISMPDIASSIINKCKKEMLSYV